MFSPLEQFDVILYTIMDVPFVHIIIPLILIIFIINICVKLLTNNFKLIPTPLQRFVEILIEFIFDLIKQQIGKAGYIYFPLLFVLFYFILFANLSSMLPFGIALTSHIIIIFWLSFSVCSSIFIIGLYIQNIKFLKIFIPECPFLLLPMLILIEIFSYIFVHSV